MKNREFHGTVGRLKMALDLMGFNGTFDVRGYFFMGFSGLMLASGNQTLLAEESPLENGGF